ncbi:MAG: diacylglycerol/lipid kinase family protein [Chloroflexota bacterium]
METTRVIVNPVAGGGNSAKRWGRLEPLLRELGLAFDAVVTSQAGEAQTLAREAVDAGCWRVIAVGGDGTVNEVVNGIMSAGPGSSQVSVGIIPTGRGVDLCRTVGVPLDYLEAARRLLDARTVRLDLGEAQYNTPHGAERRWFTNFAGLGFDVEVSRRANSIAPRGGGTIPYLSSVFLSLLSYRNRPVELLVNGEVVRRRIVALVAANGQYFGGGMRVAPQASPMDGQFDVVIVGDLSRLELIANLPRLYEGTHINHPKVQVWRAAELEVHSAEPIFCQLDGDPIGETPVKLRIVPGAINLLV